MARTARKSVASIGSDSIAEERRRELLATVGDPVFEGMIPFDNVFSDRDFNVREDKSYSYEENKDLYNSLLNFGLEKRGDMMAFSVQPDGRYKVIVGHLRHAMMMMIRTNLQKQRDAITAAGETPVDDPLPFGTIFGLVYRDLTPNQEEVIMADHALRKGLNPYEMCVMVGKSYYARGLTMKQAASYYGMTENKCQRMIHRYDMPTVLEEFRKENSKDNTPYIKVGEEQIQTLHSAQQDDKRAMGSDWAPRKEGAHFRRAWNAIIADPNNAGKRSVDAKEKRPKTQEDLKQTADSIRAVYGFGPEADAIGNMLRWAGNIKDDAGLVPSFQTAMETLQSVITHLRSENDSLRVEVESLRTSIAEANDVNQQLSKDLESERENVRIMEEEYSSLKNEANVMRESLKLHAEASTVDSDVN